ncbi:hypothetical protein AAVH_21530 [Aphelenchoides avenae]|nr:hypothetical protein AAVH_21530 [Aphelenchus avenae]
MNYAESDKWKFADDDDFYSRVPELFAELDKSELLGKHLAADFRCESGGMPTFAPFAVHYGVSRSYAERMPSYGTRYFYGASGAVGSSFSYARWTPSEGTRYFYARAGKTSSKTDRGTIRFYFHAIVYY